MIALDASVLVAAVTAEDTSTRMVEWLVRQHPGSLAVSAWGLTETSAALAFKVRTNQIDEAMKRAAHRELQRLLRNNLVTIAVPTAALAVAAGYFEDSSIRLRGADALHLAIAQLGGHSVATLDKAMAAAAHDLDIVVEDLG